MALPQSSSSFSRPSWGIQVVLPDIPLWVPDAARSVMTDLVLSTMRLALQTVAGHVSQEAPVAEGHLAQSFGADPATTTGGIELLGTDLNQGISGRVFSSLPYAEVMEDGRRPGAPISRIGIDAIGLWAQRKLGLSSKDANKAKWAIASAIIARGIQGTHYFDKGVKAATPTVEQLFTTLSEQIAVALTTERTK